MYSFSALYFQFIYSIRYKRLSQQSIVYGYSELYCNIKYNKTCYKRTKYRHRNGSLFVVRILVYFFFLLLLSSCSLSKCSMPEAQLNEWNEWKILNQLCTQIILQMVCAMYKIKSTSTELFETGHCKLNLIYKAHLTLRIYVYLYSV